MKKLIFILISILFVLTFCSCCASGDNTITTWKRCGRITTDGGTVFGVYYDVNTKVMYAQDVHSATVLLNPDGTPMLWKGDKE